MLGGCSPVPYACCRSYVKSYDKTQLLGGAPSYDTLKTTCDPLLRNGSLTLSPCGLIANSLFNGACALAHRSAAAPLAPTSLTPLSSVCPVPLDALSPDKILLSSGQTIDYDNTAWAADGAKYAQPDGFKSAESSQGAACNGHSCSSSICNAVLGSGHEGCKGWTCAAATADYYGCTAGSSYVTW